MIQVLAFGGTVVEHQSSQLPAVTALQEERLELTKRVAASSVC